MTKQEFLNKTIGFISLGCDKNRVDLEKMIYNIKSAGLKVVNDPINANIIIINTCAFLESARLEAIQNILEMSEYKSGNLEKLIVTGCLNELNYPDLAESLPEVDSFINIKDNDKIVELIANTYNLKLSEKDFNGRVLTTPNHYSYLKISDGCNNFCSYCLIPYIRGRFKSTPMEELIKEAKLLAETGVQELILVAQDTTKYGVDLYGEKRLVELIQEISKIEKIKWIRLLYCYPELIDDKLIQEIKNNPKVVKYIDIPLQHISNNILKLMNRRSTKENIYELFNKLKKEIPNIFIRTTFIVGFPGETDKDYNKIIDFLKEFKLHNVGFFKYSREEGTRAYNFENQINEDIKEERVENLYQIQYQIQKDANSMLIGKEFDAIIDINDNGLSYGRIYGQCPEIDGTLVINENICSGSFCKVRITNTKDYDLEGEKIYEFTK